MCSDVCQVNTSLYCLIFVKNVINQPMYLAYCVYWIYDVPTIFCPKPILIAFYFLGKIGIYHADITFHRFP